MFNPYMQAQQPAGLGRALGRNGDQAVHTTPAIAESEEVQSGDEAFYGIKVVLLESERQQSVAQFEIAFP